MIEKHQAQMLASLACAARPHGAPRWDEAGVMAAIAQVRHLDLAEVNRAVMTAARNRALTTPGAIGNTSSEVWRAASSPTRSTTSSSSSSSSSGSERPDPNGTCQICGKARYHCERNPHADHRFETRDEMRRQRSSSPPSLKGSPEELVEALEDPLLTYLERTPRG